MTRFATHTELVGLSMYNRKAQTMGGAVTRRDALALALIWAVALTTLWVSCEALDRRTPPPLPDSMIVD